MTYETCKKQAENCRLHGDEAGAKMYEARAERKLGRKEYFDHPINVEKRKLAESKSKEK